jgi:propionyl-CoA carboxylase alpha chain
VRYLTALELHGVATNRDYLLAVLQHPDFLEGVTTTLFVADHPALLEAGPDAETIALHAVAAALVAAERERAASPWPFAPAGWRNVGTPACRSSWQHRDRRIEVALRTVTSGPGEPVRLEADVDGVALSGRVLELDRGMVRLEVDGIAREHRCRRHDGTWYVNSPLGQVDLVEVQRFADHALDLAGAGPTAPVPGRVVAIAIAAGERIEPGQTLVVLEAMKVEHQVCATQAGVVSDILVDVGDTVDAHQLLVRVEEPT